MNQLSKNQSAAELVGGINANLQEMSSAVQVAMTDNATELIENLNTAFDGIANKELLLVSDNASDFVDKLNVNFSLAGQGDQPTPIQSNLWIPPLQEASTKNKYNYSDFISLYDNLKDNSSYPGVITKDVYSEQSVIGNEAYDLVHYTFTPANYTKTFFCEAGIHGNEKDAPQTLYRIMELICNHADEPDYVRLKELRDNVRFIIIPVVSPWGLNHTSMRIYYMDADGVTYHNDTNGTDSMNPNRNADFNHQYGIDGGTAGNYPWQVPETRHIKYLVESLGPKNIDYLFDFHDGGDVKKHFWFNYNMDGVNGPAMRQLLDDLIDYEEHLRLNGGTDYRRLNGTDADELGYIHPNVADQGGYSTGTVAAWAGISLGIPSSGPEYIGGIFGYNFSKQQMTRSLRIRANAMLYAYELIDTKGWKINEPINAPYFHFDYPIGMTRNGLRKEDAAAETKVAATQVIARWNELLSSNPTYISKSSLIGTNVDGIDIYSYTLGNGSKKVLFLGGSLRWGVANQWTEFGMYVLASYLCDDYVVNQSEFLKRLKQDYSIVVIPFIDFVSGGNGNDTQRKRCLNTTGLVNQWKIENGKCVPRTSNVNVVMYKEWVDSHSDAICIVSGGEETTGYSLESKSPSATVKYNTSYMTQIITPKNMPIPSTVTAYASHLSDDRGEDEVDFEPTGGYTCGDYAYDNHGIPTYFVNLHVSNKWAERRQYAQANDSASYYMYRNFETGRRMANIANLFLISGGDINENGGLVS